MACAVFVFFFILETTNGKRFSNEPRQSVSPVIQEIQPGELDDFETGIDHQTELARSFTEAKVDERLPDEPLLANFDIGFDQSFSEEIVETAAPAIDSELLLYSENLERPPAVPTPPSFEELTEAFAILDKTAQFPLVNVLELIDIKHERRTKNFDSTFEDQVDMQLCTASNDICPSKRSNTSLLVEVEGRCSNKKVKISTPTSAGIKPCYTDASFSDAECFSADLISEYAPSPDRKSCLKSGTELGSNNSLLCKSKTVYSSELSTMSFQVAPEEQVACPPVSCFPKTREDSCLVFDDDDDFDEIIRAEFSTPALVDGKNGTFFINRKNAICSG